MRLISVNMKTCVRKGLEQSFHCSNIPEIGKSNLKFYTLTTNQVPKFFPVPSMEIKDQTFQVVSFLPTLTFELRSRRVGKIRFHLILLLTSRLTAISLKIIASSSSRQ